MNSLRFIIPTLILNLVITPVAPANDDKQSALDSTLNLYFQMNSEVSSKLTSVPPICVKEPWPDCLKKVTPQNFLNPNTQKILDQATHRVLKRMRESEKLQRLPPGTFRPGQPIFIRAIKHDDIQKFIPKNPTAASKNALLHRLDEEKDGAVMEIWMRTDSGKYELFHTYRVCEVMGTPMPKRNEGDYLTPEGFYEIGAPLLNPNSHYHLSFDMGYPNSYDLAHNVHDGTNGAGNQIKIHGICGSIGCFAMTDALIEEIYSLVDTALNQNEVLAADGAVKPYTIPMHSFPFRMTNENMESFDIVSMAKMAKHFEGAAGSSLDLCEFWDDLKKGYDLFEKTRVPPTAYVAGKGPRARYLFAENKDVIRRRTCP